MFHLSIVLDLQKSYKVGTGNSIYSIPGFPSCQQLPLQWHMVTNKELALVHYYWTVSFPLMLFFVPGSYLGHYITLGVKSPQTPLLCDNFSVFPDLDSFGEYWSVCAEFEIWPSIWMCLMFFLWLDRGCMFLGGRARGKVPLSSAHVINMPNHCWCWPWSLGWSVCLVSPLC